MPAVRLVPEVPLRALVRLDVVLRGLGQVVAAQGAAEPRAGHRAHGRLEHDSDADGETILPAAGTFLALGERQGGRQGGWEIV